MTITARNCRKKERCSDTSFNAAGVSHDKVAPQVGIAKQFHENHDKLPKTRTTRDAERRLASHLRCDRSNIGRKGAQVRVDNSTKEQRREWAKNAAAALAESHVMIARIKSFHGRRP